MNRKFKTVISSFIAAAMTASVLPSVFAIDTVVIDDDFSNYDSGEYLTLDNSDWGQITANTIIATEDPKDPSNIVGKYTGTSDGAFVTLRKSTQLNDPLIISGKIMLLHDAAQFTLGLRDQVGSPNIAYISNKRLYVANSGTNVNTGITFKTNEWIYFTLGLRSNADPTQSKTYIKVWGNGVDNAGSANGYAEGIINLENAKLTDTLVRFDSQANRVLFDDMKMLNAPSFDISMSQNTNVSGNKITLNFNHEINPDTLDASKVSVTNNSDNSKITVTDAVVSEDLMSAEISLGSALAQNTIYKVELANNVYDIAHSRPANSLYFSTDSTEPPASEPLPVLIDGIKIEPSRLDLKLGFEERFTGKNLYTPDTLCQLKYTIYPQTADNQKLEWYSDNENVVTIDKNTGNIKTVGEGTTTVYAKATDGSGTVSAKTTVNVGPGYDTETQKMCLSDTDTPRINTEQYLSWPTEIGSPQVALWKNNNTGAFSVTIDDGISGDFDRWIAMSEKYGFNFTFFIPGITLEMANMKEPVQKLIDAGMDVSSHTYTHVSTEEQGTYPSGWWFEDLGHAARVLKEEYGVTAKTIGYSYGTLGPNVLKADNADYMHEYHIAGRGTGGAINPPDTTNYDFIGSESMFGSVKLKYENGGQWSSMEGRIKSLYDENYTQSGETHIGGWSNIHSHGIDATGWAQDENGNQIHAVNPDLGYAATVEEMLTYAFDNYLQPAREAGLVWADTFTNIAMYGQERDTATVSVTENTSDTIKFNVTDKMNDEYFDFPITIKFKVQDDWEKIGATQNGEPIEVIEKEIDGSKYIMVNAVPDRGEVTVLPNTAVATPVPTATATPTATPTATATPAPTATVAPTATPTAAPTNKPVVEGEDYVILDENFDDLAAEGEVLENKLVRAQNNKNNTSLDTNIWSINATDWSDSNVSANEPAAFVLPYDSDDDYSAYFYASSQSSYARMDYKFSGSELPSDGDTLLIEGKVKLSEYLNSSGNLGNNFSINLFGQNGSPRKQILLVRHVIDGPTESTGTRLACPTNTASDWIYYTIAITLDNDNMAQCPAYIAVSGYNGSNTEYYKSGTINLSTLGSVSNVRGVRCGVTVNKTDLMADSGSVDEMYHGIYFDDVRIMKAGEFNMTSDESILEGKINLNFSHAFRTFMNGSSVGASNFTVTGSDGSTATVLAADYDTANPTAVTLTLDENTLNPGVTYTISSTVQDVLGNIPSDVSFTTASEAQVPTASEVTRSEQIFTGDSNDIAYAYTFTVSTNDYSLTGLELKIKNGVDLLEGNLTKEFEIPVVEGSDIKFGIVAGHTLAEGETPENVTPPEFEAVPLY